MTTPNYTRTKRACYFAYLAMSSVFSLPPILFLTFRGSFGISLEEIAYDPDASGEYVRITELIRQRIAEIE